MFGKIFKEEREKAGVSQTQLAEKLGMSSGQYISNIERDQCLPATVHYKTLAKVFGKAAARRLVEAEIETRTKELRAAALEWDR